MISPNIMALFLILNEIWMFEMSCMCVHMGPCAPSMKKDNVVYILSDDVTGMCSFFAGKCSFHYAYNWVNLMIHVWNRVHYGLF